MESEEILLHRCAESEIYLKKNYLLQNNEVIDVIVKHRIEKAYRIPEIEKMISLSRLKKEIGNLKKAEKVGIPVPHIYEVDKKNKKIYLEYLKDYLTIKNYIIKERGLDIKTIIFEKLGEVIGLLHENNIIHGDLTSSNMMTNNDKIYLIDFGLSLISNNIEDKAVDLYVFEKSLLCEKESNDNLKSILHHFYQGYKKKNKDFESILDRLEKVKLRGRKKLAFG